MQDPQSLHKYAYVHGDPIQGVDPTGLFATATARGFAATATISTVVSTGISLAASALLLNSAANLVGDIVTNAVLHAKAAELGVEYVPDVGTAKKRRNAAKRHFVHGTTTGLWQGLARGIQIRPGRPLDFGSGFYTRLFTLKGYTEVSRFAKGRANPFNTFLPREQRGGTPFVLVFAMTWTDWNGLSKKYYGQPTAPTPDFQADVNYYRGLPNGLHLTGRDVVYGPTATLSGGVWVVDPTLTNQYKFEAGGAAKLRPVFLLPAVSGPKLS